MHHNLKINAIQVRKTLSFVWESKKLPTKEKISAYNLYTTLTFKNLDRP